MLAVLTDEDVQFVKRLEAEFESLEQKVESEVQHLQKLEEELTATPKPPRSRFQVRDPDADVIKAGTLRITWISGLIAALVAIGSTWGSLWDAVYGHDPSSWIKTAVLITVVAAWAMIAAVDIHARAIATKTGQTDGSD